MQKERQLARIAVTRLPIIGPGSSYLTAAQVWVFGLGSTTE